MSIDKNISEALGIEPTEIIPPNKPQNIPTVATPTNVSAVTVPAVADVPTDAEEDYKLVRDTMRDLITKGSVKLEELSGLASDLETPRAFEVYGTMLEKISSLSKDLYDLHKKKKDLATPDTNNKLDETNITVDKAVFIGTTAELLEKIKNKKNE